MAKKSRRLRRKAKRISAGKAKARRRDSVAVSRTTAAAVRVPVSTKVDLAGEYCYVLTDLRKIAIIAASMFALLFALAVVLR